MIKSALILLFLTPLALAEDIECRSQLVRMEFENKLLERKLEERALEGTILSQAQSFFQSEVFESWFLKEYPIPSIGFPYHTDSCLANKSRGLPRYQKVSCEDTFLCSNKDVPEEIKSELCVGLPCSFIKGRDMGQCSENSIARPIKINFPTPVTLKELKMTPTRVDYENRTLKGCFKITNMLVSVGVDIEFASTLGVSYDRLGLSQLNVQLDGNRDVCMSAMIDLSHPEPISNLKIEDKSGQFVSDAMINKSLRESVPYGLSGYSEETTNTLKVTVLPPMARYFRSSIEDAIKTALASTFMLQIQSMLEKTGGQESSLAVDANGVISEIGVSNFAIKKYVDLLDCSLLKKKNRIVPSEHACFNQVYSFSKLSLTQNMVPTPEKAVAYLSQELDRLDHVTSESMKKRLQSFGPIFNEIGKKDLFESSIQAFIEKISRGQEEAPLLQDIQFTTKIQQKDRNRLSVGLSFSRLCSMEKTSSHEDKSMNGCPISTYIDLNELNSLLKTMYQTGRLCHQGSGDHIPVLDRRGERDYNRDGSPKGSGCHFIIEDVKDGMSCFLNGAPQIAQDLQSGKYKLSLKTQNCFRGPVFAGQGKIGGDINFEILFDPGFCENDFCIQNGEANWNVVEGTARFALRESSFFNGIVRKTVDKKINEILKGTIRIPLSTSKGPMSQIPLEPTGETDKGPDYFGACLKFKSK